MDRAGGRRFILCAMTLLFVALLMLLDKITESIFRDVVIGVIGAYILGNTSQKVLENVKTTGNGHNSIDPNRDSNKLPLYPDEGLQSSAKVEGRGDNLSS